MKDGEEKVEILLLDELSNYVPFDLKVPECHATSYPYVKEIIFFSRTRKLKVLNASFDENLAYF